jgi:hypothetical protein
MGDDGLSRSQHDDTIRYKLAEWGCTQVGFSCVCITSFIMQALWGNCLDLQIGFIGV